jgi:hypothetical protein
MQALQRAYLILSLYLYLGLCSRVFNNPSNFTIAVLSDIHIGGSPVDGVQFYRNHKIITLKLDRKTCKDSSQQNQ